VVDRVRELAEVDRERRDRAVAGGAGISDRCAAISLRVEITRCARRRPTGGACTPSPVASDTSIEAALEPVKLSECIGEGGGDGGGRFAVQPICLD
jgi:hypothetical protein